MKDKKGSRKTKIHNVRVHKPDPDAFVTNRDLGIRLDVLRSEFKTDIDSLRLELKAEMAAQRKEYERYVGAISEEFNSRLSSIAEMVVSIAEDMSIIKQWIISHEDVHVSLNHRLIALETSR